MTLQTGIVVSRAKRLIAGLDEVSVMIPIESTARTHVLAYAAYLSDLVDGRLDLDDPNHIGALGVISQFCEAVRSAAA